jgi:hypothetical protein
MLAWAGPTAASRAEAAQELYNAGRFAEASAAFAETYRLDPAPRHIYGWAQSERRAGNCPAAVALYRRYLEQDLPPQNVEAARKNLLRCGHVWDPSDSAQIDLDGLRLSPTTPVPATAHEPTTAADDTSWSKDPWAATLVGFAGGNLVASVGLLGGWSRARSQAEDAPTEGDYARQLERARSLQIGSIVTAALGAGLLVGGIVRYVVVRHRARAVAWGIDRRVPTFTLRF